LQLGCSVLQTPDFFSAGDESSYVAGKPAIGCGHAARWGSQFWLQPPFRRPYDIFQTDYKEAEQVAKHPAKR
jgi:hypothetical protein